MMQHCTYDNYGEQSSCEYSVSVNSIFQPVKFLCVGLYVDGVLLALCSLKLLSAVMPWGLGLHIWALQLGLPAGGWV